MTRDEVLQLAADAIYLADVAACDCDSATCEHQAMKDAENVLAAFAARGIVLGETEELSKPDHYEIFDKYPEAYNNPEWSKAELSKRGLALVRVVPNE